MPCTFSKYKQSVLDSLMCYCRLQCWSTSKHYVIGGLKARGMTPGIESWYFAVLVENHRHAYLFWRVCIWYLHHPIIWLQVWLTAVTAGFGPLRLIVDENHVQGILNWARLNCCSSYSTLRTSPNLCDRTLVDWEYSKLENVAGTLPNKMCTTTIYWRYLCWKIISLCTSIAHIWLQ